jgi:hypothetical protein
MTREPNPWRIEIEKRSAIYGEEDDTRRHPAHRRGVEHGGGPDLHGLGAELKQHVGEAVSVVAFVVPSDDPGRPLLRVERFTIREG